MNKGFKAFNGVYRAVVTKNNDPKNLRRLKVKIPQLTGYEEGEVETDWVWPMETASMTTQVPDIGQGIWVSFIGSDPDYPVWQGTFGTHKGKNKRVYVKPLDDSVVLTSLTPYIKTVSKEDGTTELDLTDTLIAMANTLKDHETRITSIEAQLVTLHTTLASRTSPSHTHGSNG